VQQHAVGYAWARHITADAVVEGHGKITDLVFAPAVGKLVVQPQQIIYPRLRHYWLAPARANSCRHAARTATESGEFSAHQQL
jgi:hypothetical protein